MGENYSPGVITWAWQPGRQHEDTESLDPTQSHPGDAHTRCDIPAIETKRQEKCWGFFQVPAHQLEQLLSLSGQPCSLQVHSAVVQAPFDKVFSLAVLGGADKELVCVSGRGAGRDCQSSGSHRPSDFSLRGTQELGVLV